MSVLSASAALAVTVGLFFEMSVEAATSPHSKKHKVMIADFDLSVDLGSSTEHPRLKVAIAAAVSKGFSDNPKWRDAFAVFALAAGRVANQSAHDVTLLALMPETLPVEEQEAFRQLGLTPRPLPPPVPIDEVEDEFGRAQMKGGCCGESEMIKYYGAGLTEFDRVVVLDGDIMLLEPFDELLEMKGGKSLVGTYDYDMESKAGDSAFPVVQGGFLVFTPNSEDYKQLQQLTREGDFRPDTAWKGSNTGWAYGGAGPQGLLSFYYNMVRPGRAGFDPTQARHGEDLPGKPATWQPPGSRFAPQDRSIYNVFESETTAGTFRKDPTAIDRIKVFHFAGACMKPWECVQPRSQLCRTMTDRWWALRADLEHSMGLKPSARCALGSPYRNMHW